MFTGGTLNVVQIVSNIQASLVRLRKALDDCADLQEWGAGVSAADVAAVPGGNLTVDDATALLAALNDANALNEYYNEGLPPPSYPQPPEKYVYGQSQRAVIGPVTNT